ncbi:uncharacterized protein TNCV_2350981 [Trichonephila clavipes]|uniref:Uncharacterized protein n=1 Tax=Trichonephila clavipes TaxID=2585209 RepID=A0A8X6SS76_TRICX|nr:uncharacterized protein TNCV_2350981 [Trichonephila clavipes]
MSQKGGLSEERPSVFKTPSKLGTHLSTQCSGDEKQSRPFQPFIKLKNCGVEARYTITQPYSEDSDFVKCVFEGIVPNRIDDKNKQKEETLREFELQKIRLQNETHRVVGPQTLPQTNIELKKLLPSFNPEVDNMDLFLTLFERQMKLLYLGEDVWVPYVIGALPSDVTSLIAREPE